MNRLRKNQAVLITDTLVVPSSPLDNVLRLKKSTEIDVTFYDFINGEILTEENIREFYQLVVDIAKNRLYPTMDHLITCVKMADVNFLYVSLDNSVRANTNEQPLQLRLFSICSVVNRIIKSLHGKCIAFFSESCRPSFYGGMADKKNLTSWFAMRYAISENCGLKFLTEKRNNDDASDMSFGISVFYREEVAYLIDSYSVHNILSEGFGSTAVSVRMTSGDVMFAIHFPLDFKGQGGDNLGHKTMVNLQKLMIQLKGSAFAFGDFNMILGEISDAINLAVQSDDFEFVVDDKLTFFGAYYDTIPLCNGDEWTSILG